MSTITDLDLKFCLADLSRAETALGKRRHQEMLSGSSDPRLTAMLKRISAAKGDVVTITYSGTHEGDPDWEFDEDAAMARIRRVIVDANELSRSTVSSRRGSR